MKKIIPNIAVQNCREVLDYYKHVLGGEIRNLQLADGKEMFKGQEGKVIHAELHMENDNVLYLNDQFGPEPVGSSISIVLILESKPEIEALYKAFSDGGSVHFPLQKTFWGSYHTVLTDRYGTTWSMDYAGE